MVLLDHMFRIFLSIVWVLNPTVACVPYLNLILEVFLLLLYLLYSFKELIPIQILRMQNVLLIKWLREKSISGLRLMAMEFFYSIILSKLYLGP